MRAPPNVDYTVLGSAITYHSEVPGRWIDRAAVRVAVRIQNFDRLCSAVTEFVDVKRVASAVGSRHPHIAGRIGADAPNAADLLDRRDQRSLREGENAHAFRSALVRNVKQIAARRRRRARRHVILSQPALSEVEGKGAASPQQSDYACNSRLRRPTNCSLHDPLPRYCAATLTVIPIGLWKPENTPTRLPPAG